MLLIKANEVTSRNKFYVIGTLIYAWMVIYITILSRYPSLMHTTRLTPLWSYAEVFTLHRSPRGILLNIGLFIPLGWFLAALFSKKRRYLAFLLPFVVSIAVELIQYHTGRGTADIDDFISNGFGGAIGAFLFFICQKVSNRDYRQLMLTVVSILLLTAGCIGAYATHNSTYLNSSLREYCFAVDSVSWNGDILTIVGICTVYDEETPPYQLILSESRSRPLETVINDDEFIATGEADSSKKQEVLIHFTGHETISTGTYVNGGDVEFVAGILPVVVGVPEGAVLKAYDTKSNTLVYQDGERLLWLIGTDIDSATEVIYHLYTNELDNLPENRKRYGFDNRGFRVGTESAHELDPLNNYRVFETVIPSEYHVTEVVAGYNKSGKIFWFFSEI